MDWQLTGAWFLTEPMLTPGTEARGALEAFRGWRPATPRLEGLLPGRAQCSQLQTKTGPVSAVRSSWELQSNRIKLSRLVGRKPNLPIAKKFDVLANIWHHL